MNQRHTPRHIPIGFETSPEQKVDVRKVSKILLAGATVLATAAAIDGLRPSGDIADRDPTVPVTHIVQPGETVWGILNTERQNHPEGHFYNPEQVVALDADGNEVTVNFGNLQPGDRLVIGEQTVEDTHSTGEGE